MIRLNTETITNNKLNLWLCDNTFSTAVCSLDYYWALQISIFSLIGFLNQYLTVAYISDANKLATEAKRKISEDTRGVR